MKPFNRFKKFIALAILACFIPSQAWAQGLVIPAGSALNVNSGKLTVSGDINTAGALSTTTGGIALSGNWANTGTFIPGTGTVYFNGAKGAPQSLNSSGAGNAFYNLTHATDSVVSLTGANLLIINNNFTNTPPTTGAFNANGLSLTVDGNWDNAAASAFISGGNTTNKQTVTLSGGNQEVLGTTTFYNFTKTVTSPATLTFDATTVGSVHALQTFTNNVTMGGTGAGDLLTINSTTTGTPTPTQAYIALVSPSLPQPPATQNISNVDVFYSNAGGGLTLIARGSSIDGPPMGTNTNWDFGTGTLTWTGSVSTDWNNPDNWNLGLVPTPGDTVQIPGAPANQPDLCPVPSSSCTDVSVGNLILENSGSSLTLSGYGLTVSGSFTNFGDVILAGTEPVFLTPDPVASDNGTFTYVGNGLGPGSVININGFGTLPDYANLVIDGNNTFQTTSDITATGNVTVASGLFDISTNADTLTVGQASGDLTLGNTTLSTNGTLLATNASLVADGGVDIATAGSTLTAPSGTMSVAGNFTDYGTFNDSNGTVVLNGGNQTVLGTTTFYNFTKTVTSPNLTLTFDSAPGTQQTFNNSLILGGNNAADRLTINSTTTGTANPLPGFISLISSPPTPDTATQNITNVDVFNSNASGGRTLVAKGSSIDGPPTGTNINWLFGNVTFIWTGGAATDSTDWNNPDNWNLGSVPGTGDTVEIPGIATAPNQPDLCPASATKPCADVAVADLTIDSTASLTLSGAGLTVYNTFANSGNVILEGTEALSLTQDTDPADEGTFTYIGNNTNAPITIQNIPGLADYYNLVLDSTTNPFQMDSNVTTAGDLTVVSGTLTILPNTTPPATPYLLTVGTISGDLIVGGSTTNGTLIATNGSIAADGSVDIDSGSVLTAPKGGDSFTVADNFTDNGTFNNSSGAVTFNTTATSIISGNTTFYDFVSNTAGKTIEIATGSNQTVLDALSLFGTPGNLITLSSTLPGTTWDLTLPIGTKGAQYVAELNVEGSDAINNTVTCLNCTDSGHTTNWIFANLSILAPANGTTVGQTPTVIGSGLPNSPIGLKDSSGNWVATTKADANGHFRVVVGQDQDKLPSVPVASGAQLALGANSLTPYLLSTSIPLPGVPNAVTVVAAPTTNQIPTIGSPTNGSPFNSYTSTVSGQGAPGETVTVQALDASGNLIMTDGSSTVAADGSYVVSLTTYLPDTINYLSVTVGDPSNETASALIMVYYANPFGFVYNTSTNQPIQGVSVTLYDATTKQPASGAGVQSCNSIGICTSANPYITQADGFYGFLAPPGQYYFAVSDGGYTFPSKQTTVPPGRVINPGSKGEVFTISSAVAEIDVPLDAGGSLLRLVKTANKSEAHIGDIVTYTVNIQNLTAGPVPGVLVNDNIPPGFKYVKDRVILNSIPIANPSGQRPLFFNVGTIPVSPASILQYQLVIGSGVTMASYQNTARAQLSAGNLVVSNPTSTTVKIILDPVFDLGTVIGKVFFDWNENGIQDAPRYDDISHETIIEKPVPNVQIVMEDGTVITTDRDGQFNIPGLLPGRHLFRLDERTLPPGAYLTTDKGMVVDITAGSIAKVNFGINIDQSQISGRDAVFFNEKIRLTQDRNRPVPRLNAALFDASANAKPNTEEVLLHEGALVRQAEFRIFTNYVPFIGSWHLDILDADTKKLIKSFEGTAPNINDPVYWNGKDTKDIIISGDRKYSYVLSVMDAHNNHDDTKERPITVREIKDDVSLKKETDESKDALKDRAARYRKWLDAQSQVNNLDHQLIPIRGETVHLDRQGTDVRSMRVMQGNHVFTDIPLVEQYGLTPQELMTSGFSAKEEKDNLEIILPNGDYSLDVVSVKPGSDVSAPNPVVAPASVPASAGAPSPFAAAANQLPLEHYSRPLKVGDDYIMFVGLGDAKVGYNIDRGHIDPIQSSDQQPGFYAQGKGAYYLKGQILGKYLITSSFDTDRQQKALFRSLDPNVYYPVYGDKSSINYDAADTQGPLYLKVEWDKSTAILGNYAVDFNDTEFAAFSRSYYGGVINYQSVASNPYGDARTKIVVYQAHIQQLPSHNEFLATGGSLYFLKYKNVIEGSDTITLQVRDQTTGLVLSSQVMTNGADYELDRSEGRILFWQPVAMIAQSNSIISNNLINGNPIYVVIDYQYAVSNLQIAGAQGARIAQAVGDNVVLGGTYVQDNANGQNYTLSGVDATLHVNKDSTVKTEYAQTSSQEEGSYVSTDGGITFTPLILNSSVSGKAYGIKGDTRLFDNIGLKSYYKWVGNDFGATDTTYQQGKETMGLSMTFDMTPVTRLTASEDIQRLLAGGNLQTSTQVGASETDTTMVQIVHTAERLKLTGQFQMVETKSVINGITSTTNQRGATMAGQAQYDVTDRIKLTLGQQVDVINKNNTATTLGIADRITDQMTLNAQEIISQQGHAITAGVTNQLTPKIALTTNYTLANLNTGTINKTASVMVTDQISKNVTASGTVAQTASSTGGNITSASVGTKAQIADGMTLDMNVGKTQNAMGAQGGTNVNLNGTTQIGNTTVTGTAQASGGVTTSDALGINTTGVTTTSSFGVKATTQVDNNNSTNGSVTIANESTGAKTTTFGFGNTSKIDQELQAVSDSSFSFSPDNGMTNNSKYGLVNTNAAGQKTEADYTRQLATLPTSTSQANIYGLSGDVNDKLSLNGSVESGKVQNLDATQTNRTDFSVGAGYVLKDTETAVTKLQNSLKLELRLDKGIGTDSLHQYVLYDALQGKITDNLTGNIKVDYSKTLDVTTGAVAERHQEIILGMAYRPINFDNLNLIAEYSYQDGYGGGLQQADALNSLTQQTVTQVFTTQAIYDMTDHWQLAEKIAYRLESEQDTGFQFTQTHTWLVVNRLNYKIDSDWMVGGEFRNLSQVEAKDNKQGVLLEAIRHINDSTELAIGWNFTKYNDDLTNLNYTSQGPYVRMTGKFYDRSPAEKARMRAKWLDERISEWAWIMVRKELAKKDSQIMLELNHMFALAHVAQMTGHLQESRQIYKDIITAGQMMFNEACEYIRGRIAFEEKLQEYDKTAREYFKGGEYVKARKIWEKVVADASKGMVK